MTPLERFLFSSKNTVIEMRCKASSLWTGNPMYMNVHG